MLKRTYLASLIPLFLFNSVNVEAASSHPDDLFALSLDELLDVTVSVRKVKEPLQRTPISVSLLTSSDLSARSSQTLLDAVYFLPNMDITTVGENSGCTHCANITIRGVGQVDPIPTTDPSVGLYLDDVYHARSAGGIFRLLDVERIEVMRGPQGTVFGKNTIGGAVHVITNPVSGENELSGKATAGSFDRRDIAFIANARLSDSWAGRLAVGKYRRDGFVNRLNGEQQGGQDETSLLAKLHWQASDNLALTISFDKQLQDNGSAPSVMPVKNDNASLLTLYNRVAALSPVIDPIGPLLVFDDKYRSASSEVNENTLNQGGLQVKLNWQLGAVTTLKSVTSLRSLDAVYSRDFDNNPVNIGVTRDWQKQTQRSQEFNLSGEHASLDWLLGLFVFDESIDYRSDLNFFAGLYSGLESLPGPLDGSPLSAPTDIGGPGNPLNLGLDIDNTFLNKIDNRSYAIFGHTNYRFMPDWTFTLGGRLTLEHKRQQVLALANVADVVLYERNEQSPEGALEKNWRVFSPMASVQYQANDDVMLYLSLSRGFKSGGFNGLPNSAFTAEPFDPEYLTNHELGLRSAWLDNRLRVNLTGFVIDHSDMQLRGGESTDQGLEIRIDNVGQTRTKGVELELKALLDQDMGLDASLYYIDAQFTDVGNATQVAMNSKLIRTPDKGASIGVWKTWSLQDGQGLTLRVDGSYRSKAYLDVFNNELATQGGYTLWNARLDYALSGTTTVSAYVTNLTDTYHLIGANDFTVTFGVSEYYLAPPRESGLELKMAF